MKHDHECCEACDKDYTDHAAEVSALKASVDGLHNEASKWKAWSLQLEADRDSLRAQLEAATADAKRLRAFVESMVSAVGPYPFLNGHGIVRDAYEVLAAHIGPRSQLTAQPDGVRLTETQKDALKVGADMCELHASVRGSMMVLYAPTLRQLSESLAAPAPSCKTCV